MVNTKFREAFEAWIRLRIGNTLSSFFTQRSLLVMDMRLSRLKGSSILSNSDMLKTREVLIVISCSTEMASLRSLGISFEPRMKGSS